MSRHFDNRTIKDQEDFLQASVEALRHRVHELEAENELLQRPVVQFAPFEKLGRLEEQLDRLLAFVLARQSRAGRFVESLEMCTHQQKDALIADYFEQECESLMRQTESLREAFKGLSDALYVEQGKRTPQSEASIELINTSPERMRREASRCEEIGKEKYEG